MMPPAGKLYEITHCSEDPAPSLSLTIYLLRYTFLYFTYYISTNGRAHPRPEAHAEQGRERPELSARVLGELVTHLHLPLAEARQPAAGGLRDMASAQHWETLCVPLRCPQQLSRPISHTHLAHISRYEQGNLTGNTRRLCPPQPGLPDWHGQQKSRGAPCPSPCICHKPRGCCDVVQMLSLHPCA